MSLRHDELPPLTPAQQAEALRLAARLQAEASSTDEFLRAAEEAGIERRFLDEAIRRLPAESAPVVRSGEGWPFAGLLAATLAACVVFPPLALILLISAVLASLPCALGRRRRVATATAFAGWLVFDALFVAYFFVGGPILGPSGLFPTLGVALGLQALASVAGVEAVRQVQRIGVRASRRRLAR